MPARAEYYLGTEIVLIAWREWTHRQVTAEPHGESATSPSGSLEGRHCYFPRLGGGPTADRCHRRGGEPGSVIGLPIIPSIIAGMPSVTNPVTSRACARMAWVRSGSDAVSTATTPLAVKVMWR
jgi:hypothetical protein